MASIAARIALVMLFVGLAACGDDDSPAADPTSSAPSTGSTESTESTATPTTTAPRPAWQLDATEGDVASANEIIDSTHDIVARYPNADAAAEAGYVRINAKHLMNLDYMFDEFILDPEHIESLVVDEAGMVIGGMYVMNLGDTLDDVPDDGGPLFIWHSHGRLCATDAPGLVPKDPATGECPAGATAIDDLPMVHVWLEPQPNDDGTPRDATTCGTFQFLDLPHETTIEGCSGQSAGGGNAITHEH